MFLLLLIVSYVIKAYRIIAFQTKVYSFCLMLMQSYTTIIY